MNVQRVFTIFHSLPCMFCIDLDCEADPAKNANAMTSTQYLGSTNLTHTINLKQLATTQTPFTNYRLCVR